MTNIKEHLGRYKAPQLARIARDAGTSLGYLRVCMYGQRRLSAELALRLERASGGAIRARKLRPDLPWPGEDSSDTSKGDCPPTG